MDELALPNPRDRYIQIPPPPPIYLHPRCPSGFFVQALVFGAVILREYGGFAQLLDISDKLPHLIVLFAFLRGALP